MLTTLPPPPGPSMLIVMLASFAGVVVLCTIATFKLRGKMAAAIPAGILCGIALLVLCTLLFGR